MTAQLRRFLQFFLCLLLSFALGFVSDFIFSPFLQFFSGHVVWGVHFNHEHVREVRVETVKVLFFGEVIRTYIEEEVLDFRAVKNAIAKMLLQWVVNDPRPASLYIPHTHRVLDDPA